MKKTILEKLVKASYNNQGILDEQKVFAISDRLRRKGLKLYIKALRRYQNNSRVLVETSAKKIDAFSNYADKMFPGKKIEYKYSPSLLLGIRITDSDIVYEANLSHSFDVLLKKIEEYD